MLLHAPNIHSGGGAVLLRALLEEMPSDVSGHLVVDQRFDGLDLLPANWTAETVPPDILSRLRSEWVLRKRSAEVDFVLCFGNLPPLFAPARAATVFLQNRNLLPGSDLSGFSAKVRVRHLLERIWLQARRRHAFEFIVQTESMRDALQHVFGSTTRIRVQPFAPKSSPRGTSTQRSSRYDFVYVASGDPHKNHRTLIGAWELLARQGRRPSLLLTVDPNRSAELAAWIQQRARVHDLAIENRGESTRAEVLRIYQDSQCLIFPSYSESLGLPLLEAAQLGIPILAGEIDSVRDIVTPTETFDPRSAVSISRAVCRFMGWPSETAVACSAGEWISALSTGNAEADTSGASGRG